jgi:hypothetical protein
MAATRTSKAKITKPAAKAADQTAADNTAAPGSAQGHERIAVRSIPPSFRRAGLQFSRAETVIDVCDLTHEQRKAIESESRLTVRAVTSTGTEES